MTKQGAELNEAHCLRVLCAHPCCYVRGDVRHTPAPVKRCSPRDEDLPSLSIVNVSEWIGRRRSLYKADSRASLNDACVSFTKQSKDSEMIRRPDLSSSIGSFSNIPTNEEKKMVKLNTINIGPLIAYSEMPKCPVVMWSPNPHHAPQWLNQNKSPKIAIKELICPTFSKSSKVAAEERTNWQVQRRKRFNPRKWRLATLEGAGTSQITEGRWVGIGFNPIPKITPHQKT